MLIKQIFPQMTSAISLSVSCRESLTCGLTTDPFRTLLSWFWKGSWYHASHQLWHYPLTSLRVSLAFGMSTLTFKRNIFNLHFLYLRILYLSTVSASFCQSGTQLSGSQVNCRSHRSLTLSLTAFNLTPSVTKPLIPALSLSPPQLTSDPASLSPLRLPIWALASCQRLPETPFPAICRAFHHQTLLLSNASDSPALSPQEVPKSLAWPFVVFLPCFMLQELGYYSPPPNTHPELLPKIRTLPMLFQSDASYVLGTSSLPSMVVPIRIHLRTPLPSAPLCQFP